MKINERHLNALAVGNSPTDREGSLQKRGEVNKSFQKRWFVLKGNLLFYFEKRGEREPIGVIILEGCTVELSENCDAYTFEIVFQGSSSRTYVLAAESQEEMEDWMKCIACAGYDYMKLMVAELQRQLDEFNLAEKGTGGASQATLASVNNPTDSLLVDLTVPGTDSQANQNGSQSMQQRSNPFNGLSSEEANLFAATPFQADHFSRVIPGKPRTFEAMHEQFGAYIQSQMRSYRHPHSS